MKKIDAHQHFWKFNPQRDKWITEDMAAIRRDFMPKELHALLVEEGFDGSVVIQSSQSEDENIFQLKNAEQNEFIKGVVGWIDFQNKNVQSRLEYYKQFEKMKGFRHIFPEELQRDFMLNSDFRRGIRYLNNYGFTYDILIFPDQLLYTNEFVASFPDQKFIIDHIAKPYIKDGKIKTWKKDLEAVARYENVYCKISGMVTEANWRNWEINDFFPYLDVVLEVFGIDRVMYGSDWPVCLVAASYKAQLSIIMKYISNLSKSEQEAILGQNAINFYQLSVKSED